MKISNKALFVLLIASLGGIYFFIEKPQILESSQPKGQLQFLAHKDKLLKITTTQFSWHKGDQGWLDVFGKVPLNEILVEEFLGKFAKLEVLKTLSGSEKESENELSFIPSDAPFIEFETSEQKVFRYELGTHLGLNESFYLSEVHGEQQDIHIVKDKADASVFYDPQRGAKKDYQYRKWQTLFSLKKKFFWDRAPFKDLKNPNKIWISTSRRDSLLLDLENDYFRPRVITNIKIDKTKVARFLEEVKAIQAVDLYPEKAGRLEKYLVKGEFFFAGNKSIRFFVMGSLNDIPGFYLFVDKSKFLYKLTSKSAQPLIKVINDFYYKVPVQDESILNQENLALSLKFANGKKLRVTVSGKDNLSFKYNGDESYATNIESFQKLLKFLLAEAPYRQADSVAKLKKMRRYKKSLQVEIGDLIFQLYRHKDELLVVNEDKKLVFSYIVGKKEIVPFLLTDYFVLQSS